MPGQTKAKLFAIVNEDCAARGISQVYFKSFSSKKIISESKMIVSLELWEPKTAGITVVKKAGSAAGNGSKPESDTEAEQSNSNKSKTRNSAINKRNTPSGNNSSKSKSKSPASDTRNTAGGRKAAKNAVK